MLGPVDTTQECISGFLHQARKYSPFPDLQLFSFWDKICHFQQPGHWDCLSISKCFCSRQCDQEQRALLTLSLLWKCTHNSLPIKHRFEQKTTWWTKTFSILEKPGPGSVLRSGHEFWIFFRSPTGESNFHYCCLCSLLINSTRSLESPAVQKIEPQPGSEELMQSGQELLFEQDLTMTHKRRCLVFEIQ